MKEEEEEIERQDVAKRVERQRMRNKRADMAASRKRQREDEELKTMIQKRRIANERKMRSLGT